MKQRASHSSISPASYFINIRLRLRIALTWILLTSTSHHPAILHRWHGGLEGSSNSAATATAFSLASIFPRMKAEKVGTSSNINTFQETSDEIVKSMFHNTNMVDVLQNTSSTIGHPLQQDLNSSGSNLYTISQHQQQQQQPQTLAEFEQKQQYAENTTRTDREPIGAGQGHEERSVHLQLNEMGGGGTATVCRPEVEQQREVKVDEENSNHEERTQASSEQPKTTQVRVLSYVDSSNTSADKLEWVALNTSRRKFLAFLDYNNVSSINKQAITTKTLSLPEPPARVDQQDESDGGAKALDSGTECVVRKHWRVLWKSQRLLTDRTEILAVYKSDKLKSNSGDEAAAEAAKSDDVTTQGIKKPKRGGFSDLLSLYTHRLVAILSDERRDERNPPEERHVASLIRVHQRDRFGHSVTDENSLFQTDHRILIKWLEDHYGVAETQMLQASRFRTLPVPTQLELMNHFLSWFRNHFPYYYDRCDACGASQKDDLAAAQQAQDAESLSSSGSDNSSDAETHEDHGEHDHEDDNATFLGYIYPSEVELKGKASRTELYQCHKCNSFTRFPRFNSAFDIIQSRRGRCGEYSLLLYRFLRTLNHDARWVVDWADHVWAEVLIGSNQHNRNSNIINNSQSNGDSSSERWVHLDPCEAAVDNPLLYESWGKKQTYIVALYAPLRYQALRSQLQQKQKFAFLGSLRSPGNDNTKALMIEDVTHQYTSDTMETIRNRRDESEEEVEAAIVNGIEDLQKRLLI